MWIYGHLHTCAPQAAHMQRVTAVDGDRGTLIFSSKHLCKTEPHTHDPFMDRSDWSLPVGQGNIPAFLWRMGKQRHSHHSPAQASPGSPEPSSCCLRGHSPHGKGHVRPAPFSSSGELLGSPAIHPVPLLWEFHPLQPTCQGQLVLLTSESHELSTFCHVSHMTSRVPILLRGWTRSGRTGGVHVSIQL